eukprot:scaffold181944_cov33-Prasinocladus_malaysianus.AAC.1
MQNLWPLNLSYSEWTDKCIANNRKPCPCAAIPFRHRRLGMCVNYRVACSECSSPLSRRSGVLVAPPSSAYKVQRRFIAYKCVI